MKVEVGKLFKVERKKRLPYYMEVANAVIVVAENKTQAKDIAFGPDGCFQDIGRRDVEVTDLTILPVGTIIDRIY